MSCDKCQDMERIIKRPQDLTEAILLAYSKLEIGELYYLGTGFYGTPLSRMSSGKGWSDIVSNYFECCNCGQIIYLHAETYHGSGGRMEFVTSIKGELGDQDSPYNKSIKKGT